MKNKARKEGSKKFHGKMKKRIESDIDKLPEKERIRAETILDVIDKLFRAFEEIIYTHSNYGKGEND